MNQMNAAAMNQGNPAVGNMPMMNKMPNGVMPQQTGDQAPDHEARLNTWIYGYFLDQGQYDLARSLKDSNLNFEPPIVNSEDDTNGVSEDVKGNLKDKNRPSDLPIIRATLDADGGSMLSGWFAVFWDVFAAHRKKTIATTAANQLMEQNRMRAQGRGDAMFRGVNGGMVPNAMDPAFQQMMMRNPDLRQKALQNQQQGLRGMNPQMAMQRNAMLQQPQQQGMRRDPSGMEMNGQRPRTPSSGDHAPSPKRPRVDGAAFNAQQMMQNGRPPPGMPPGMEGGPQASALLSHSGINPGNLSDSQFMSFQQQQPSVQQKSIQLYAQNLGKGGRGDDPMSMPNGGAEFYNQQQMMRNGIGPAPGGPGPQGNHALQDYQMQLMLLEQQNKKRLLMARQEQDGPGQPGVPPGFAPGMSPSGSRGGPSPGPGGERRGTPKMGGPGMDGSPLPDGSMRGSPAAMPSLNGMQPDLYASMAPGVRPPPSSAPAFNGQFNPQMQLRQDGQPRMPAGNWQGGPPGQGPMGQQPSMGQQPPQMGTPQPRNNEMPPPQAPPAGGTNGRNGSDEAPPTPQPAKQSAPKTKKESKKAKGEGKGKKNPNSVAATPASEAEGPPPTPTPSTPITPSHPNSFNQKETAAANTNANANAQQVPGPQTDLNVSAQFNPAGPGDDQPDGYANAGFNDPMQGSDLLDSFNFEEFLDHSAFNLDLAQVDMTDMMEPMADAA